MIIQPTAGRIVAIGLVALAAACAPRDPQTPAEKAARGDELLRKMSDTLKAAPALSFKVVELHEGIRRTGENR